MILEIIKDKLLIKNFYNKTVKIKNNFNRLFNKIKSKNDSRILKFIIANTLTSVILTPLIFMNFEMHDFFHVLIVFIALIFTFGCPFYFNYLIENFINKKIKTKSAIINQLLTNTEEDHNFRLNNFLVKFEKSLSPIEIEFLKTFKILEALNEEEAIYSIYSHALKNTEVNCLIENKFLILEDIKKTFSVNQQKKLLTIITSVIKSNTTDNELSELDCAINNMQLKNKPKEKIKKNVLIKNI
jgi:hypothetical protein